MTLTDNTATTTTKAKKPMHLLRQVFPFVMVAFLGGWSLGSFSTQQPSFSMQTTSMINMGSVQATAAEAATNKTTTSSGTSGLLPDWRLTTDCSAYSRDCVLKNLAHHGYADYPFKIGDQFDKLYNWNAKPPEGWKESFDKHTPKRVDRVEPTPRPATDLEFCLNTTRAMSVKDQVANLLRRLTRAEGMVAFAISDYSYTQDMIQDVFEMAHNVVGFKDAFFLVAIDVPSMVLACQYHYPFLAWPQPSKPKNGELKAAVANTKFEISLELIKHNQNFFFFEMDVWFVRSALPLLRNQTADIVFSAHQNNPEAANIGVYSVLANKATKEYFQHCIDIIKHSPDSHDQAVMQEMYRLVNLMKIKAPFEFGTVIKDPKPKVPEVKYPVHHLRFSPYQIVADERPVPNDDTVAIHPLCGVPLRPPHGKKMVAKELGAWYGAGSYFGRFNRYLWFDGHVWNGHSFVMKWPGSPPGLNSFYHNLEFVKLTVAVTVALARRTNRIWVMPKVLNDAGVQFLWHILDMQSVESLVEVRETNFPSNYRAWNSPSVPFDPVARTALARDGRIFVQLDANSIDTQDGIQTWRAPAFGKKQSPFDLWFALHTIIPEVVEAEVLLAGMPDFTNGLNEFRARMRSRDQLSPAETEIKYVLDKLRWCFKSWSDIRLNDVVGYAAADSDCYGRGS